MANEEHLAILEQGVDAWNQWRTDSPEIIPDLRGADLSEEYLCQADLFAANLAGADLSRANLFAADLSGTNLTRANFLLTNLFGAFLSGANLSQANLSGANLSGAFLHNANLDKSKLEFTVLANLDLSLASGLASVVHELPSSVGVDTLAQTLRGAGGRFTKEQLVFFEGAGVPPALLEDPPNILEAEPLKYFRCFISYSSVDEAFADRLNQDLKSGGVQTWMWNLDAVAGRDLRDNIDRALTYYDKMILICSNNSLTSGPVGREIEKALQKEDQLNTAKAERVKGAVAAGEKPPYVDTNVLVPIRTDDFVFQWVSP